MIIQSFHNQLAFHLPLAPRDPPALNNRNGKNPLPFHCHTTDQSTIPWQLTLCLTNPVANALQLLGPITAILSPNSVTSISLFWPGLEQKILQGFWPERQGPGFRSGRWQVTMTFFCSSGENLVLSTNCLICDDTVGYIKRLLPNYIGLQTDTTIFGFCLTRDFFAFNRDLIRPCKENLCGLLL